MVKSQDVLNDEQDFLNAKDNIQVRKGTIAATLLNAKALDELFKEPESKEKKAKFNEVVQDIRDLVPSLHGVNLFQFFTPIEWFQAPSGSFQQGRAFVAVLYLQQYPQFLDKNIQARLREIEKEAVPELKKEIQMLQSLI